ncbi:uncharacterized protein F5147DRAFT_837714 [Suillus discolor]|uniref:Uncharacterized protein n=1 Tax=Suillus discolor TaxID=1912936 RepID=A0A9P7F5S0_9AGAM|nr:uncharacterized protein F5147DRAFT_837714 [Suillus discolor]KAG2106752.1 hypothetical protein F5147DRAFT_837714 [Suillus discolor]
MYHRAYPSIRTVPSSSNIFGQRRTSSQTEASLTRRRTYKFHPRSDFMVSSPLNYKINLIPPGYPLIACVSNATSTHESEKGYLKFVKEGGKEIEILQYLTGIDSPANHTISGARIWPVRGSNVISMPVAGGWLTSLIKPSAHLYSTTENQNSTCRTSIVNHIDDFCLWHLSSPTPLSAILSRGTLHGALASLLYYGIWRRDGTGHS